MLIPGIFLPREKGCDLMGAIDRCVPTHAIAIALLGEWQRAHAACELPLRSINLSAHSLKEGFAPVVRERIGRVMSDKHDVIGGN